MSAPAITLIALVTVVLAPASPASACSCDILPLADYADEVAIAFSGRQIERTPEPDSGGNVLARFEVERVYTGQAGPTLTVSTYQDEAGCGIDPGPELSHLAAFRWGDNEIVSIDLCGSQVSEADLTAVFGPGEPPDLALAESDPLTGSGGNGLTIALVTIGGLTLLGGAGAVIYRRRA